MTRICYKSMRHEQGDEVRVRDCIVISSSKKKDEPPYIAKVTALWEHPKDGKGTKSLLEITFFDTLFELILLN